MIEFERVRARELVRHCRRRIICVLLNDVFLFHSQVVLRSFIRLPQNDLLRVDSLLEVIIFQAWRCLLLLDWHANVVALVFN